MEILHLPKRKSPRIPNYDYGLPNYYFITICTHNKKCYFGSCNQLNEMGMIAKDCLSEISNIYPGISVDRYVVMPNHIHAILVFEEPGEKNNLSHVVGQYKMSVTKKIHCKYPEITVWQRSFHDHVIRSQSSYEKIWNYIDDNPRKWEEDCFYVDQI